ncbi:hypothetical protein MP638_006949 [Amoeboaphelidium occidentale]|nr:hypothetical protein MP638_006949 [Amoeboaphelidium occidentale]
MADSKDLNVGLRVQILGNLVGTVRFMGATSFATGKWVGIELDEKQGKNDGSVQGKRYFECKDGYGMFVRASQVKPLVDGAADSGVDTSSAARRTTIAGQRDIKPASASLNASRRPSSGDTSRRETIAAGLPRRVSSNKDVPVTTTEEITRRESTSSSGPLDTENKRLSMAVQNSESKAKRLQTQLDSVSEEFAQVKSHQTVRISELTKEIHDLRMKLQNEERRRLELEEKCDELNETVELITLDKEVAEERVELLLADLKEKETEMLSVPEEERQGSHTESTDPSMASAEVEKLKQAIIKLRDTVAFQDNKLKHNEIELKNLEQLRADLKRSRADLMDKAAAIEDLKVQIDDLSSNSYMVEMLTEKNLKLTQENEDLMDTVADLEALKLLNEELEESHLETENELRQEIENKEREVSELLSRVNVLEKHQQDQETLIAKYKENVTVSIENLTKEAEKSGALFDEEKQQEMLDLAAKFNSATQKLTEAQELNKILELDVELARDELNILKHYIPQQVYASQLDMVQSYLSVRRVILKLDLLRPQLTGNSKDLVIVSMIRILQCQKEHIVTCNGRLNYKQLVAEYDILGKKVDSLLVLSLDECFKMLSFAREILSLEMFEPDFVSNEVYKSFLLEVSSYLWVLQASLAQDEFVHCFDTIKSLSRSINNLMASCNSSEALVKMDVKSLCSTIMNRNDVIFDVLGNSMSSKTKDFLKENSEDLRDTLCIDLLENARLEDLTDQNRYRMPWEKFKNESENMTQKQVSLENEIVNLKEEVTLNQKQSRVKEELLQQAQVKIELLEKKMDIARKESAVVDKYEAMYEKWKNQEAVYKEALDKLQNTVETLKQQNQASLADKGSPKKGSTSNVSSSSEENNVSSSKLDILLRHSAKSRQNQVWSNFLREFTEPDPLTEFSKANLSRPKENLFIKEAKTAAKEFLTIAASSSIVDIEVGNKKKWKSIQSTPRYNAFMDTFALSTFDSKLKNILAKLQSANVGKDQLHRRKTDFRKVGKLKMGSAISENHCTKKVYMSYNGFKHLHRSVVY